MNIEQSWGLLEKDEQQALMRLSVFRGEFDRCAAQVIADCTLAQIKGLFGKSLLCSGLMGSLNETPDTPPGWYKMLAEVRQFALQRLAAEPNLEENIRKRHAGWFADIAQRLFIEMNGERQSRAYAMFATLVEDVQAAWDFALEKLDEGLLQKIPSALVRFHNIRGNYLISLNLLEPAIAFLNGETLSFPPQLSGQITYLYAETLIDMDRSGEAQPWVERGLALARQANDDQQTASYLNLHARILWLHGNTAGAQENWQELSILAHKMKDQPAYLEALNGLGKVYWARGEHSAALEQFQKSLRVASELQADIQIGLAQDYLGVVYREMHDYETARRHLEQAAAILRKAGAKIRLAYALNHLAGVQGYLGEVDQEMQTFAECLSLAREAGERRLEAYTLSDMSDVLSGSGELSKAFSLKRKAYDALVEVGDLLGQVIALTGMAQISLKFYEERSKDTALLEDARNFIRQALELAIPSGLLLHFGSVLLTGIRVLYRSGLVVQPIQALAGMDSVLKRRKEGEDKNLVGEIEGEFTLLTEGLPDPVVQASRQMGAEYSTLEDVAQLILQNL